MHTSDNLQYQQRNLLVLVPLMLLALVTWILDSHISESLAPERRNLLLNAARYLCPCLFAAVVALIMPPARISRAAIVTIFYLFLSFLLQRFAPEYTGNPAICVLAANSYILVMPNLQHYYPAENEFEVTEKLIALFLPFLILASLLVIVFQIKSFILAVFNDTFGQSLFSMIFAPIFLILQSLELQETVNELAALCYQNDMISPFINSIYITNIFSLPTVIIARSLFTSGGQRLFLTMLALIALMTSSVGACVSLIYIVLIIFWPGTFAILLLCSLISYLSSYLLSVPAVTTIDNLYLPDLDFSRCPPFFHTQGTLTLELIGILTPFVFVLLLLIISRELSSVKRRRRDITAIGVRVDHQSSLDLRVLAFLRALGGISNIAQVRENSGIVLFKILDPNLIIHASINNLCLKPASYDRFNETVSCYLGAQGVLIANKISLFLERESGEPPHEIVVPESFVIRPLPHIKNKEPQVLGD